MTTAKPPARSRRKPAVKTAVPDVAAQAVDVLAVELGVVEAGGLHWPASDGCAAPVGFAWATEFAASGFVSTVELEPLVASYVCPTCDTAYYCAATVCGESRAAHLGVREDFHEPAKVVPVS